MTGDAPSPGQGPGHADESRQAAPAAPLALYRRYRPASFAEVKGQDHVTEPLRQALRSGRVNHAYLFSGPRGCGKTSSARILARSLNCEKGPTPDPCGVCASCVALAPAGPGSIDVIEIDAASHGGVDDARDLRERAFYAPVAGRFKIYIIDEAHMVTREGFNALLKLVEEPPPHLKFVFATTEPEKVIATIRSRTHHYPFRLVPPAILRELLEGILASEGVRYEPTVLPVVIRAGAGSVRDSLSVLDQLIAGSDESGLTYARAVALLGYTDDALLDEVVQAFAAQNGAAVFGAIDRVVEGGHDPRRFAADLLDRLRDLIVLAAVPDAVTTGLLDVPADRLDTMRSQADGYGQAELTRAAEIISAGLVEMRGATSPRLLLELMAAQVLLPAAGDRESDLRVRLERLEKRLESGGPAAIAATRPAAPAAAPAASAAPAAPAESAAPRRPAEPAKSGAGRGQAGRGQAAASGPAKTESAGAARPAAAEAPVAAPAAPTQAGAEPGPGRSRARRRRPAHGALARRARGGQARAQGRLDPADQRDRRVTNRRRPDRRVRARGRREGLHDERARPPAQRGPAADVRDLHAGAGHGQAAGRRAGRRARLQWLRRRAGCGRRRSRRPGRRPRGHDIAARIGGARGAGWHGRPRRRQRSGPRQLGRRRDPRRDTERRRLGERQQRHARGAPERGRPRGGQRSWRRQPAARRELVRRAAARAAPGLGRRVARLGRPARRGQRVLRPARVRGIA